MANKKRASGAAANRRQKPGQRLQGRPVATRTRSSRARTILLGVVVAIVIAGFVAPLLVRNNPPQTPAPTTTTPPPAPIDGLLTLPASTRNHVTSPVTYAQTPPVGGDHDPVWLNCGYYSAPVRAENAVHSMEHGAVWITYRPDLAAAAIATLRDAAHSLPYLLVSPYPGLPAPIVASAWGRQVRIDSVDDPRLGAFVDQFRSGPQAPERGSPCESGTGTPE